MSFGDLPENWSALPVTESRLVADVLGLTVNVADRADRQAGCTASLACDCAVRFVQPILIEDVPEYCDPKLTSWRTSSPSGAVIRSAHSANSGEELLKLGGRPEVRPDRELASIIQARRAI